MPNWHTPEQADAYLAERAEQKRLWDKWKSGELYEELLKERKAQLALERERRRKTWPQITYEGETYYSIAQLAIVRGTTRTSAHSWAKRHPTLCVTLKGHTYCRNAKAPSEGITPVIVLDGKYYYSMPELGRRHESSRKCAYHWALDHPHLTIRHNGRLYALDEEYRPASAPPSIIRDGLEYLTVPELARRRGVRINTARAWAARHPEATRIVRGHVFVRDLPYVGSKTPPVIWQGTVPYYSVTELARRRGIRPDSANDWVKTHPHLSMKLRGHWYARDEEWKPKDGRATPNRVQEVAPWLKARAAR